MIFEISFKIFANKNKPPEIFFAKFKLTKEVKRIINPKIVIEEVNGIANKLATIPIK